MNRFAATDRGTVLDSGRMGARLRQGLVSYWPLDEAADTRRDAYGSLTLTDNNTVTGNPGPSPYLPLASQFTAATTEYLSRSVSSGPLTLGDIDFTVCTWVYMATKATDHAIVSSWTHTGDQLAFLLWYASGADRFQIALDSTGAGATQVFLSADSIGVPAATTWYFIVAGHDARNNQVFIQVNGGPRDAATFTTGVFGAPTGVFEIGAFDDGTPLNGRECGVGLWKRVLTLDEVRWLYRSGLGRMFPWRS